MPGWQQPPSRHRVVQRWDQAAGTESKSQTCTEIETFSSNCHISSSLLLWHQLGSRIQRLAGGQYLEIQDVRPEDSGQYSCVVTNIAGSNSLFFTVEILCKSVWVNDDLLEIVLCAKPKPQLGCGTFYSSSTTDHKGEQLAGDCTCRPACSFTLWSWRRHFNYDHVEERWLPHNSR